MELYDVIRDLTHETVKNMDPTDIRYATVTSVSPLELEIQSTSLKVSEPVAVMTDAVSFRSIVVSGQTVVINPGLVPGDKVLALKTNSGQNYIVISKA